MKFLLPIVISISGIGVTILVFIMPTYINFIEPYADYILFFALCLIFGPWLLFFYIRFRDKRSNSRLITPTDTVEPNNPDLFRELNETALKKHIDLKMEEADFNSIIQSIFLYATISGEGALYRIIIRAPKDHVNYSAVEKLWES